MNLEKSNLSCIVPQFSIFYLSNFVGNFPTSRFFSLQFSAYISYDLLVPLLSETYISYII